jgi:hypothetical protein
MPKDFVIEMNWEKQLPSDTYTCDNCKEDATMECEVNVGEHKVYGAYCKAHYGTLFDDLLNGLAEPASEEDYLIDSED